MFLDLFVRWLFTDCTMVNPHQTTIWENSVQYSFGRLSASNIYQRMDVWYLVTCIHLDRYINQMCANAKSINILQVCKCIIPYILTLLDASAPKNIRKWTLENLIRVLNSLLNMWQFWCLGIIELPVSFRIKQCKHLWYFLSYSP